MSVQLPCSLRILRTEIVRSPCGDRPSHGAHAGIVQCHLWHVYGLRAYNFFKFVKVLAKPNRRGRGAHESVQKSHSRLLPPQGGLTEAARKGGYGQDTGSVDPSQAKCELGMNYLCLSISLISGQITYPDMCWSRCGRITEIGLYIIVGQAHMISILVVPVTNCNMILQFFTLWLWGCICLERLMSTSYPRSKVWKLIAYPFHIGLKTPQTTVNMKATRVNPPGEETWNLAHLFSKHRCVKWGNNFFLWFVENKSSRFMQFNKFVHFADEFTRSSNVNLVSNVCFLPFCANRKRHRWATNLKDDCYYLIFDDFCEK